MKKLRMIVTSVIVLAIVGSAFAFNAKKVAVFCVDSDPTSGTTSQCDQVVTSKQIVTSGGTLFNYYNGWSGQTSTCTSANTNCPSTSQIRLATNS